MTSVLLRGGRVVDPGNGVDEERDVLVVDGRIADARNADVGAVVDCTGLVVGPGFIDLHSHAQSIAGHRLQAFDGVTTSLELEAGLFPVALAYERAADAGRPLNYGYSASWGGARAKVLCGLDQAADLRRALAVLAEPSWQVSSTQPQLDAWIGLLREELDAGALGIGVLMGYAPRTEPDELVAVGRLAAEYGVATYTHVREIVESDPTTPVDGPSELGRVAALTGAHMHHCHVNSTSRRHIDRVLHSIAQAQAEGSPVTVEAYPYGSGSTGVGAYFLAPERLPAWGLTPSSITVVATGEVIASAARLAELRATDPGALVIARFLDEQDPGDLDLLRMSLEFPDTIVASDAMPVVFGTAYESLEWPLPPGGQTHPRTAGTFAKAIRTMVGSGAWTWSEAFRRCSWLPAQVLSFVAGAKGHLGPGADADIVVLDPATVSDRASYTDPVRPSAGVRHLLVHGTPVISDGALDPDAMPGRPLRR